jgi:hypothetical protein
MTLIFIVAVGSPCRAAGAILWIAYIVNGRGCPFKVRHSYKGVIVGLICYAYLNLIRIIFLVPVTNGIQAHSKVCIGDVVISIYKSKCEVQVFTLDDALKLI